jgi:predicted metal-dependent hydrolase
MSHSYSLTIDGVTLHVTVERKAVKHINARLRGDELRVSAPRHVAQALVEGAIPALARRLVRRRRAREVNRDEDALQLARTVAARFPACPEVSRVEFVTTQEARWGSYSATTGTVRLHAALRHMPRWVLEAVVAHELAHIFHLDHSPAFWSLLRRACPDTDRAHMFLAGVSWLAGAWDELPPVERAMLARARCDR